MTRQSDTLRDVLVAHGADYDALIGPIGKARNEAAVLATRILIELAESVYPFKDGFKDLVK